jgi:hypothetical protein
MVIQDLEMELETTTPTEPTIQSPVLSSSFHFADEFKRSFDDEAPEMKDSESLTELAQIIENIIGKVSVTLDRVTIKLKNSNSWRKDLNDTFVLLKMDRISLCDHINQKESIPASLLDNQNDIISRVVKYLELSRCSVLLEREQKSLVLFHLTLAYVRLLFSQQDYLDDSVHSSVYGMANSVILGDFHIAVQSEMITLFTRTQDLIDLIGFMDAQQKESLKKEKQRSSNDPVMFQLFLGEMVAYLAGNEEDVGCINSEKIDTVEHLKFQLQNIKVDNHYSNFPSFSITSSFTDCNLLYYTVEKGLLISCRLFRRFGEMG